MIDVNPYIENRKITDELIRAENEAGRVVFVASNDAPLVTVDIDSYFPVSLDNHVSVYPRDVLWTKSKSGNTHAYALLEYPVPPAHKSVAAVAWGGDPKRELFSLMRYADGESRAWALFETKDEAARVREWGQRFDVFKNGWLKEVYPDGPGDQEVGVKSEPKDEEYWF